MSTNRSEAATGCSSKAIIEWLFGEGRRIEGTRRFVHALAHQMNAHGASIDRLMVSLLTLNPQLVATSETWLKSTDTTTTINASHDVRTSERYIGSPLEAIYKTHKRVRQRLDNLPEDAHRAYTELAEDGFTDYLALPVLFGETDEPGAAIIICTKREGGFTVQDVASFRQVRDYVAPVLEVHALRYLSRSLMNTYVGKRTSEKVLAGMVKRGDADIINAALWFSDLRDFTHITETLPAKQVLEMLNEYFEFVAAAVGAQGGEILRFIGDAMLIVFPIGENMCIQNACQSAIDAAIDAHNTLEVLNHQRRRNQLPEIEFGVGLNVGEVIYGNVGAPDRLDFTVMGPAVNRTARLESLTKELGRSILFSKEFAKLIDQPVHFFGDFAMKGIAEPQPVYGLESD
ncbi:MAG: adenylate/guanylate cyclase domain-containing protein [Gammaproteobacteria bacterium]|nr:adenylate/guanylate cyclase domain-containing protein [Gammaproteobacteria bacterium]MDH3448994.1 adenylate/guanylate cyclase domain-containing protein [Gammaproteobacteria bacterium]